jgi:prepilin-type N-terminal cleavage/methylation domain-containing protein
MQARLRRTRRGFTLVELLVVIGIIALLIAMLLPALGKVKEQANGLKCQANLRTLMQGVQMFAADYKGQLPGNDSDYDQVDWWKRCPFIGPPQGLTVPATALLRMQDAPTKGTLWKYIRNKQVYLCPSAQSAGQILAGGGTNEYFDYVMFKSLSGAKLSKVKSISWFNPNPGPRGNAISPTARQAPTPYITQEHPATINNSNPEPGHSNVDAMTNIHSGGAFYASIDGSVHWFQQYKWTSHGTRGELDALHLAMRWVSKDPLTNGVKHLGRPGTRFGDWNNIPATNW